MTFLQKEITYRGIFANLLDGPSIHVSKGDTIGVAETIPQGDTIGVTKPISKGDTIGVAETIPQGLASQSLPYQSPKARRTVIFSAGQNLRKLRLASMYLQ